MGGRKQDVGPEGDDWNGEGRMECRDDEGLVKEIGMED